MLLWEKDPLYRFFIYSDELEDEVASLVPVPFNPTAEEMARFLLRTIGPLQLEGTGAVLTSVTVWETRKCYATATLNWNPPVTYTTEDTMEYKAGQGDADGEIPF
jgi:6-pyruvoyltetrahydropterin/6-carboxytetrahydropterin synthase